MTDLTHTELRALETTTARSPAAHIAAEDVSATRYTTLLRALSAYSTDEVVTVSGKYRDAPAIVTYSRALHIASVHISHTPMGGVWPEEAGS